MTKMADGNLWLNIHQNHVEWKKKLDFYEDEISILQKELYKTIEAHPDLPSVMEHIYEYRGILLKKKNRIEELKFEILLQEKNIGQASDEQLKTNTAQLSKKIDQFILNAESMKKHVRRFISHNMK
ncbi:MAG: hypothetical protein IPN29_11015 [Saprospiraceae bacterium]|nr:hypothetical protein [Saprospiraceae bacterium]